MQGRQLVLVASLALACGNDEDVGGTGDSQSSKTSDSTTTTGENPTTTATVSDTDSDSDSQPSADDTTTTTGDDTTETVPPDPLVVDCGDLAEGAVAANYSHQPVAVGGNPAYVWAASGLPDGLAIDKNSGKISGVPTTAGSFAITIKVTDDDDTVAESKCPDLAIHDKLHVDLNLLPGPCLGLGESLLPFVTGGDNSPIECTTPKGVGDGDLPDGITIDAATCEIVGAIEETRFGTWAWIVRARQSGAEVFAPYCATQNKQAPKAYKIYGAHSGGMDNALEPLEWTFDPGKDLKVDGDADPAFEVTREVCGDSCFFGFAFKVSQSPLTGACASDKDKCAGLCPLVDDVNEPDGDKQIGCSLVPKNMSPKTGFAHELWAKGDTPPAEFADRPFVQQWSIDYCITTVKADCGTKDAILANGDNSNLEFPVILRPQP